jgi:N-acetylglucosamine malate deacetylase 2
MSRFRHSLARGQTLRTSGSFQQRLWHSLTIGAGLWPAVGPFPSLTEEQASCKVLLVVAHPDDESECAATLYRMTHELGAIVDQVVVTNGEAGHQYSAPAQAYYRRSMSPKAWQKSLVHLRRQELLRAGRILGIRHHYFLDQQDTGFTLDPSVGFASWNCLFVRKELFRLLERENYDLVFLLLPAPESHGHHQTVAVLTLEAISALPVELRPGTLGVETTIGDILRTAGFLRREGYSVTQTTSTEPVWSFARNTPMACHDRLDYSIVVNWVIAEHKSQGLFQTEFGRRTHEQFWLFAVSEAAGSARWEDVLQKIQRQDGSPVGKDSEYRASLTAHALH